MDRLYAALAVVFCGITVVMLSPFDESIVFGLVTAYGLRVVADRLEPVVGDRFSETAFLLLVLSFIGGSLYLLFSSTGQMVVAVSRLTANLSQGVTQLLELLGAGALTGYVSEITAFIQQSFQAMLFEAAANVPWLLLQVFAYCLIVYYGFTEGVAVWRQVNGAIERLPEREHGLVSTVRDRMLLLVKEVFVVYGVTALILAGIAAVGFYGIGELFLGYPLPFWWFWAIMVGVSAFLPVLASGFFLAPMVMYYAGVGEIWFAFWLGLFSLVFLWILPETVLRPWLGSSQLDENYLVIVLGFTAGVMVFGPHGMVTGPVIIITAKKILMDELGRLRGVP